MVDELVLLVDGVVSSSGSVGPSVEVSVSSVLGSSEVGSSIPSVLVSDSADLDVEDGSVGVCASCDAALALEASVGEAVVVVVVVVVVVGAAVVVVVVVVVIGGDFVVSETLANGSAVPGSKVVASGAVVAESDVSTGVEVSCDADSWSLAGNTDFKNVTAFSFLYWSASGSAWAYTSGSYTFVRIGSLALFTALKLNTFLYPDLDPYLDLLLVRTNLYSGFPSSKTS